MRLFSRMVVLGVGTILFVFVGGGSVMTSLGSGTAPPAREEPVSPAQLALASRVALAATGGSHVTDVSVGDEDGYYEIEVALHDGRWVEVQLDESFDLVVAPPELEKSDSE